MILILTQLPQFDRVCRKMEIFLGVWARQFASKPCIWGNFVIIWSDFVAILVVFWESVFESPCSANLLGCFSETVC
jgi:hypothetical protein